MELSETVSEVDPLLDQSTHVGTYDGKYSVSPTSLRCQVVGNWLHAWLKEYVYVYMYR